jgi:hypothetical protein
MAIMPRSFEETQANSLREKRAKATRKVTSLLLLQLAKDRRNLAGRSEIALHKMALCIVTVTWSQAHSGF